MDRSAYIVSLDLIILISGPVTGERLTEPGSQSGEHLTSFMFTGQTISCQTISCLVFIQSFKSHLSFPAPTVMTGTNLW